MYRLVLAILKPIDEDSVYMYRQVLSFLWRIHNGRDQMFRIFLTIV